MNRETKRAMARQQKTADPQRLQQLRKQQLERQRAGGRDGQPGARRSRLRGVGSFGSEVVAELRKVNWPDRRTVAGYTVVVLVAVTRHHGDHLRAGHAVREGRVRRLRRLTGAS